MQAGTYQVRIFSREVPGQSKNPTAKAPIDLDLPNWKERIPAKVNHKSELKADVKKGGGNSFNFALK
jgi:hypothetical protein